MIELRWVLAVIAAAVGFASISVLVAVRRVYFLAAGLSHASLVSAVLAIPLYMLSGVEGWVWATLLTVLMVVAFGFLFERGRDPERVSAVFVSFTASAAVLAMYYVLTSYPYTAELWAYVLGDPLLVTWRDLAPAVAGAVVALGYSILTYWEHVCIGVDRDTARLAGLRVKLYDVSLLAVLAATTVLLLRIVGFVLAHVFVLLPGVVAVTVSPRASMVPLTALTVALVSGVVGLAIGVALDVAPSGVIGLIMLTFYLTSLALRGRR